MYLLRGKLMLLFFLFNCDNTRWVVLLTSCHFAVAPKARVTQLLPLAAIRCRSHSLNTGYMLWILVNFCCFSSRRLRPIPYNATRYNFLTYFLFVWQNNLVLNFTLNLPIFDVIPYQTCHQIACLFTFELSLSFYLPSFLFKRHITKISPLCMMIVLQSLNSIYRLPMV